MISLIRVQIPNVSQSLIFEFNYGAFSTTPKTWRCLIPGILSCNNGIYCDSGNNVILHRTTEVNAGEFRLDAALFRLDTVRNESFSLATQIGMDLQADAAFLLDPLAEIITLGHAPNMHEPLRRRANAYAQQFNVSQGAGFLYQGALHGSATVPNLTQRSGTITWVLCR